MDDKLTEEVLQNFASKDDDIYRAIYVCGREWKVEQFLEKAELFCTQRTPGLSVRRLDGENFQQKLVYSFMANNQMLFYEWLRSADVLIFGDLDKIQRFEETQATFYGLFDYYYEHGKKIIIGANVHPFNLEHMMRRIITQCQGCLILNLDEK